MPRRVCPRIADRLKLSLRSCIFLSYFLMLELLHSLAPMSCCHHTRVPSRLCHVDQADVPDQEACSLSCLILTVPSMSMLCSGLDRTRAGPDPAHDAPKPVMVSELQDIEVLKGHTTRGLIARYASFPFMLYLSNTSSSTTGLP